MSTKLLRNIRQLVNVRKDDAPLYGKEMAELPCLENAWLITEGKEIASFGTMDNLEKEIPNLPEEQINCSGRLVLPAWCDSHTHLVFAGSREMEFVDKIRGLDYAQINARGGGILSTVRQMDSISEDELFRLSWQRLEEVAKLGTGAIEIKSGYGLTVENELKMLRVIRKLKDASPLQIRSTFLGAHTYPLLYRENHLAYIKMIVEEMLPVIARDKLADYIDVFCEKGFFSAGETESILSAGQQYGLRPKLHVNQLHSIGGITMGIKMDALSMDHLETMNPEDVELLRYSGWKGFCTLLPTAAFFLRMSYPPARKLLEAGAALALASDYNPGSSPSGNMNTVISMACIQMKMGPEEALNAATVNGAYAMGLGDVLGSIRPGKLANLILTEPVPSLAYLPYRFGNNCIDKVMLCGQFVA
ncbi:MAG TPA: imidazolonepropionase [Puia sp.]